MLCCLVLAVTVVVVFLALLELCKTYSESGDTSATDSVEADGEIAGGVQHSNPRGVRKRRTRYARLPKSMWHGARSGFALKPNAIDACCLSSQWLNSIMTSLKNARPLRSIYFEQIAYPSSWWYKPVNMRCHTKAEHKPTGMSIRVFAHRPCATLQNR